MPKTYGVLTKEAPKGTLSRQVIIHDKSSFGGLPWEVTNEELLQSHDMLTNVLTSNSPSAVRFETYKDAEAEADRSDAQNRASGFKPEFF